MAAGTATRMWALDGAHFTFDSSLLVVGCSGEVTIPVPTFLIEHPRGLVLFDTGVAPSAVEDAEGTYGELAGLLGLDYPEARRVDRQIESVGFSVEEVTHVVISHSHFDHVGGVHLFPHAQFFVGASDLPYAFWPMPAASVFFRPADLEPARGFRWNLLSDDHDLFGDGSLQILRMPGHTPGNQSMLVRLPGRTVMLTGDTVHLRVAVEGDLPMPSDYNTLDAVNSVRRLKQITEATDATLWIHHDPEDWRELYVPGKALD